MRAWVQPFAGASGDMLLGALVAAQVPLDYLRAQLKLLPLHEWDISATTVDEKGLAATRVRVRCPREHHHRHLSDIVKLLHESELTPKVVSQACKVFTRLAEAEARVHGVETDTVHFHEVGAMDAILDVVGTVLGLDYLGVEELWVDPLPVNTGRLHCEHGVMPVPAPATLELLKGWPVVCLDCDQELLTPTGAALLTTLGKPAEQFEGRPAVIGYGAGQRRLDFANVVRLTLLEPSAEGQTEQVVRLETNLDDTTAELLGYVLELCQARGALDSWITPATMKKSRPGWVVSVLCRPEQKDELCRLLLQETPTLGVRIETLRRQILPRRFETRGGPYGEVRVKITVTPDGSERVIPEFEQVKELAQRAGVPLQRVWASLDLGENSQLGKEL